MDILNWIYVKTKNLIRTTPNNSKTDLIVLGAEVPFTKREDAYQTYGMTVEDLGKSFAMHLDTTLFAYPYNYVATPVMLEGSDTISGTNFFFGNTINLKSYKIVGKIAVGTNFQFWPIGTISANVPLNGDFPWKVSGVVEAFDDVTGNWLQTGLSDGARFSDTAGGTADAIFCTIMEDYNSTPGSIELFLAVGSSSVVGDIYGNVAFQYEIFIDESINLVFTV